MGDLKLHADLVILSSCMSGFGHVDSGDELFGLQRAFLYAGAPVIVCTLAKTRDTVAMLVMEQFYRRLRAGMTVAQALRDALVAVRGMTRDDINLALARFGYSALSSTMNAHEQDFPLDKPEYWAPFILIGRP